MAIVDLRVTVALYFCLIIALAETEISYQNMMFQLFEMQDNLEKLRERISDHQSVLLDSNPHLENSTHAWKLLHQGAQAVLRSPNADAAVDKACLDSLEDTYLALTTGQQWAYMSEWCLHLRRSS